MIAVRISPDVRFVVVATRHHFNDQTLPQTPNDLINYNCINLRQLTYGGLWAWEFEKNSRQVNLHVDGHVICNSVFDALDSVLAGLGVAYIPEYLA
jgi:DNA-binding transcriptional LysR family regulator